MGFWTWITTAWLDSIEVVGRYSLTHGSSAVKTFHWWKGIYQLLVVSDI